MCSPCEDSPHALHTAYTLQTSFIRTVTQCAELCLKLARTCGFSPVVCGSVSSPSRLSALVHMINVNIIEGED